jgi:hypothetical protein
MNCPTCDTIALNLQHENSLLNIGWYYCTACKLEFNDNDIKVAELAHWKAVDVAFTGFDFDDFDWRTGDLINYA